MTEIDQTSLRAVLTFLNIGMAAMIMALALAFATDGRTESSLVAIERYPGRFRFGILLSIIGTVVLAPSQVPDLLATPTRELVNIAGYPLIYAGVFLMASATWRRPWPPPTSSETREGADRR